MKLLKNLLLCTTIALLAACGSQESAVSDKDIPTAGVNIASSAPDIVANTDVIAPPEQESKLLSSLATTYPNGQLPAERAAQAALDLAQNPAALKQTMQQTAPIQAQSGSIQPQSAAIQPQATAADYLPVQRIQNTTLYGAYFFSIYAGEVATALTTNPNWRFEGPAFWASLATGVELNPVHRFQNKLNGSYLFTIYDGERANIVANYSATFAYEGIAWYARQTPASGWSALYRFRNKTNGTYLFSAYESEKNAIVANYPAIFELEGIAYYVRQDAPVNQPVACTAASIVASEPYSLVFKGCSAANVAEYYDKTECVRQNATGTIWQGQTAAGVGLRANDKSFTNFDSLEELQKRNGATNSAPTQADYDAATNVISFVKAMNASNLCGSSGWRLPFQSELLSIVRPGYLPSIDSSWFPNTRASFYWSSTPDAGASFRALGVDYSGGGNVNFRENLGRVRLVR